MIEITYQMVLSTLQTLGLLVGIYYYVSTLRNQQRSQKHVEETRKYQLLHDINQFTSREDTGEDFMALMKLEWTDYDDFMEKYGWENNPSMTYRRQRMFRRWNFNGLLIRDGLIDVSSFVQILADNAPVLWNKFGGIVKEMRVRIDNPDLYIGFEILAKEVDKYRISRGLKSYLEPTS
jgi:hypothetical protein